MALAAPDSPQAADGSIRSQVERVLSLIRTAVQADGGDVEFVGITAEGVVEVRFHGACVGCPASSMTLQAGIEKDLKRQVAGVTAVKAVA